MIIKKSMALLILLQAFTLFSKNSLIIMYGCSSAGKTSISSELLKILPGSWKYIAANQFTNRGGNIALWNHVNATIASGFNVIVDTHSTKFLIDNTKNIHVITVLLYCSPEKLIEHVSTRNTQDDSHSHRKLKVVFEEYCQKFKSVKKNQNHIDTIQQNSLKNNYGFFVSLALKKITKNFFNDKNQQLAYIAPILKKYDSFIDTGKISIASSAQKIKNEWQMKIDQ